MIPSAILFDMDGLLIDSESIALRTFQQVCDSHDLGDQFEFYLRLLGTNDVTTARLLHEGLPASIDADAFKQTWMTLYREQTRTAVPLMKGVLDLLDYLEGQGIAKSVATSTETEHATQKLVNCGIAHRFTHITGGNQIRNGKPAPDIYLLAAKKLHLHPAECLVLEDSPNGVKAGLQAGMPVIQIPALAPPDAATRSLGHTILNDLVEVITWLKG